MEQLPREEIIATLGGSPWRTSCRHSSRWSPASPRCNRCSIWTESACADWRCWTSEVQRQVGCSRRQGAVSGSVVVPIRCTMRRRILTTTSMASGAGCCNELGEAGGRNLRLPSSPRLMAPVPRCSAIRHSHCRCSTTSILRRSYSRRTTRHFRFFALTYLRHLCRRVSSRAAVLLASENLSASKSRKCGRYCSTRSIGLAIVRVTAAEVTSLGCHTDCGNRRATSFQDFATKMG